MDEKTVRALNAINRSFYADAAREFSETRRDPWPGWTRLPPLIEQHLPDRALGVLDVGCGNGRFGAFLADALPLRRPALRYCGVDASEPLLAAVRARGLPVRAVETHLVDIVETPLAGPFAARRFSLIAVFGLLHHVPGEELRRGLLRSLAELLEPGGLLVFAIWRFEDFERFRARLRSWEEFNAGARERVDLAQLEPGDRLLPWGAGGRVRYCHFIDADETRRLLAETPLGALASYEADGREGALNRYFVLRVREGT
jgi:SAM-dependent methyltransferase